jgi:hypothetical protein
LRAFFIYLIIDLIINLFHNKPQKKEDFMSQPTTPTNSFISVWNNLITLVSPRCNPQPAQTPRSVNAAIKSSGAAAAVASDESKSPKGSTAQRGSVYESYDPTSSNPLTIDTELPVDEEFQAGKYTMTPPDEREKRTHSRMTALGIAMSRVFSGIYNLVSPSSTPSTPPAPEPRRPAPLDTHRDSIIAMNTSQNGLGTTGEYTAYISPHVRGTSDSPYGYYDPSKK